MMTAMRRFRSRPQPVISSAPRLIIAIVGLAFEARIAATPEVLVLCGQAGRQRLTPSDGDLDSACRAIVSFGVAGGLAPDLRPGDLVVASAIVDSQTKHHTNSNWSDKLLNAMPDARFAPIAGVDAPVVDPRSKREINLRTGAVAIDMESHHVARLAAARNLDFVAIRVVVDPVDRVVPPAALAGMRPNGSTSLAAVIAELMADPWQAAALARIAVDLYAARNSLVRAKKLLGHSFGLANP